MRVVFILLVMLMWLISCKENKNKSLADTASEYPIDMDGAPIVHDTVTSSVSVAADGAFDDFVWNFMRDKKFQKERIRFPLPEKTDGKTVMLSEKQWCFDALYVNDATYSMIYDSEKSVGHEKEKSLKQVVVERISLKNGRVKQYLFDKIDDKWLLTELNTHSLSNNANSDFFTFYRQFVSDSLFQQAHIANPFEFKTYDSDTFQEIDGVLGVEQWPDFMPDMPKDFITNLNYGQKYVESPIRVMVLTSLSAGMSCTLVFKKQKASWKLTRLEDL